MTAAAREEILRRIRAAAVPPAPEPPRHYLRHAPGTDPDDRPGTLALFAERLAEYGARVLRATDPGPAVARALHEEGARSLVVPDGLPADWTADWDGEVRADRPPLGKAELDATDAVLTSCAAAVADSGTLVLDGGPAQGRRAVTLLPDLHVCVVRAEQVHSALSGALAVLDPARPLTFVSGPSATADIEMIRVKGVHGPRRLVVVLLEAPSG
ncbi:LutC/YkgG family protein [Kitasatospora cineracea]|uniref:L-lactate dehydrogenase complex protein LldG n=1 Tax=Kitasatospora cineracea TaxID=88074 RepID=A0A8G1UHU8_9ACTN|nr:LUD domain-containing protein [Kitasatospora cineracea]ROR44290.1 L-lactate dehydrogenase complex protein LldG [Kitasatospora cineracea]